MSLRYKGGVISATPPTTTGGTSGTAKGVWTLEQQLQAQAAGNWPIPFVPNYIEDVFSTYLYTGNNTNNRSFTNNIDLSGDGGLVWIKSRGPTAGIWHGLFDTARGANKRLVSNNSDAEGSSPAYGYVSAFNADGFTVTGGSSGYDNVNLSNENYASWTFRKAEKFFDVVTYTGNGTGGRTVAHNLGSVPGCIIVKRTDTAEDWAVYHRSLGNTQALFLNYTSQADTNLVYWNNTSPTSTQFSVGSWGGVNANGGTYVAYLFAHDAGGFGLTGSDNVITCGSFVASNGLAISLGYEPQFVMLKASSLSGNWLIMDNMRGMPVGGNEALLRPNTSGTETATLNIIDPTATGFTAIDGGGLTMGATYIYIAIRRGPMKTPTSSTTVFSPVTYTGNGSSQTITSPNFAPDMLIGRITASSTASVVDKMRGSLNYLYTSNNDAEVGSNSSSDVTAFTNTGFSVGTDNRGNWNTSSGSEIVWTFGRAPGFFDVVCYTGTGSARTVSHNLGVAPELMIIKNRSSINQWSVNAAILGTSGNVLNLATSGAAVTSSSAYNSTAPTSSVFTVGTAGGTNSSGETYVAYLFASVSGVSKVGSYTGTGTTLQVNCGFTNGARFVLIKRTNSTGDWYVWDSARGIVAGNDPYLLLNSTAAEVTNTDYVDTYSAGFEISSTAPTAINANGSTFIFLAIA